MFTSNLPASYLALIFSGHPSPYRTKHILIILIIGKEIAKMKRNVEIWKIQHQLKCILSNMSAIARYVVPWNWLLTGNHQIVVFWVVMLRSVAG
jgi:hypothetical protein